MSQYDAFEKEMQYLKNRIKHLEAQLALTIRERGFYLKQLVKVLIYTKKQSDKPCTGPELSRCRTWVGWALPDHQLCPSCEAKKLCADHVDASAREEAASNITIANPQKSAQMGSTEDEEC